MLERLRALTLGLSALVVVGGVALYAFVSLGGGETLFGSEGGALEAVNFDTLDYQPADAGYLLCDPAMCPLATPDGPAEILSASLIDARRVVASLERQNPLLRLALVDYAGSQFDFVERQPASPLADVVTVRLEAVPQGEFALGTEERTRISIFSRRPLGSSSSADHHDRVARWITTIRNQLQ